MIPLVFMIRLTGQPDGHVAIALRGKKASEVTDYGVRYSVAGNTSIHASVLRTTCKCSCRSRRAPPLVSLVRSILSLCTHMYIRIRTSTVGHGDWWAITGDCGRLAPIGPPGTQGIPASTRTAIIAHGKATPNLSISQIETSPMSVASEPSASPKAWELSGWAAHGPW